MQLVRERYIDKIILRLPAEIVVYFNLSMYFTSLGSAMLPNANCPLMGFSARARSEPTTSGS